MSAPFDAAGSHAYKKAGDLNRTSKPDCLSTFPPTPSIHLPTSRTKMAVFASLHSFLKLSLLSLLLVATTDAAITPLAEGSSVEISGVSTSVPAVPTIAETSTTVSELSESSSISFTTTSPAPSTTADSTEINTLLTSGGLKPVCKGRLPRQGTARPEEPFWLEAIKHQGKSPYNPDPAGYKVFRNIKVCG